MEGSGALSGVSVDATRDDAGASRVVDGFFGRVRSIPKAHSLIGTPVHAYYSGGESFAVHFGEHGASFDIWTDVRGMEAMIESLQSVLVRARIERDAAGAGPLRRFEVAAPVDTDLPF